MRKEFKSRSVGQDDLDDIITSFEVFKECLGRMGVLWRDVREQIHPAQTGDAKQQYKLNRLWELLPAELVCLLDDVSDVLICDEDGCLEQAHTDDEDQWDFCKKHGEQEQED